MKAALCLYGQVGGQVGQDGEGGWLRPQNGHKYLDNILLKHYETDVFAHSWEITRGNGDKISDEIISVYTPKKHEIVEQIQFKPNMADYGLLSGDDLKGKPGYDLLLPSRGSYEAIFEEYKDEAFKTHSRWHSVKRAIELKKEFEDQNDFKYDFVLLSRYDMYYSATLELDKLNPEYFYAGPRTKANPAGQPIEEIDENDAHIALEDLWFLAGSENMDKFGQLYDNIHNYCIRPPIASREHVEAVIGKDKLKYLWWWGIDYGLLRNNTSLIVS